MEAHSSPRMFSDYAEHCVSATSMTELIYALRATEAVEKLRIRMKSPDAMEVFEAGRVLECIEYVLLLASHRELRHLDFHSGPPWLAAATALALCHNTVLRTFKIRCCPDPLPDTIGMVLAKALRQSSALRASLGGAYCTDETGVALAEALKENSRMRDFQL